MEDDIAVCSAKGCRAAARWVLVWNNPRLHTPGREKRWVACDAHRESLAQFLGVRGFLRRVEELGVECAGCGASLPAPSAGCPVCAGAATGAGGSRE